MYRSFILIALAMVIYAQSALAQSPLRFKQMREIRDGGRVEALSASDFELLGDPMFSLLLKKNADKVRLSEIQNAIQPEASKRHLFVVDEAIVSSTQPGGRRVVIAFEGTNGTEKVHGNVMLSVFLSNRELADLQDIEAWGWDNLLGRYNYYKLDAAGSRDGARTWKFRGSSVGTEFMSAKERVGTCMRCHVTGAPIMKELFIPWNNWHAGVGGSFTADYLVPSSTAANKWPVASTSALERLSTADKLEVDFMVPALRRFNESRVNGSVLRTDATGNRAANNAGRMTVLAGRRLLRSLFETVEVNLISSRDTSGAHPLGTPGPTPAAKIRIPLSFFLNADLMFGQRGAIRGLGIAASEVPQGDLTQEENNALIAKFNVSLGNSRGDTHFAWFVPEVAFIDNQLVDLMIKQGIVSPQVVAAAMAIDLEKPVFSAKRAELMKFVPDRFEFTPIPEGTDPVSMPRDPAKDELAKAMIAAIDAANPPADSAASEFRTLLKSSDAVSELQQRVTAYAQRLNTELDRPNPARRQAELERLFKCAIDRRRLMLAHPILKNLQESRQLLALPPSAQPAACA